MNKKLFDQSLIFLRFQRNVCVALSFLLSLSVLCLSICLVVKKERIIVTPPILRDEVWLDASSVSPSYLEQMGVFLGQLLLSKHADSAEQQKHLLSRHVSASFWPVLKNKLVDEAKKLKRDGAAYVFYPTSVMCDIETKSISLKGERVLSAGGKVLSRSSESYVLHFVYSGGRLLLDEIEEGKRV